MMSSFARSWYFARARGSTAHSWRAPRGEIVEPRDAGEIGGALPRTRRLELQDLSAARRGHGHIECEAPPFARSGEALRIRDDRPRHAFVHATHGPLHAAADAHAVGTREPTDLIAAGGEQEVLRDRNAHLALAVVDDLERAISGTPCAARYLHRMADVAFHPARWDPVEAHSA